MKALQTTISGKTRAAPKGPTDLTWDEQFERLRLYLDRLGMTDETNALSVIHVAGTKGKGSTCAFVEHIMRECDVRTGLYTSPHLVDIRERFRINGEPVSKTTFTKEFWWLFNSCRAKCADLGGSPAYFRFLTLLGFRIFAKEKVQCAILEVGLGGRLDATNLIRAPVVCGVTSLGMDHVEVLGDTIAKIAREKAGIFKPRVPAFTSPQIFEAMEALQARADELGIHLETAPPLHSYSRGASCPPADEIQLGLAGAHQKLNAALAVRLVREWAYRERPKWGSAMEADLAAGELPETFRAGLAKTEWWGRAQIVSDDSHETTSDEASEGSAGDSSLVWYLDGAHTEESMAQCAEWFCDVTGSAALPMDASNTSNSTVESGTQTDCDVGAADSSGMKNESESKNKTSAGDAVELFESVVPVVPDVTPPPEPVRLLLFNCMEERDPLTLLTPLAMTLHDRKAPLTHAAFFAPAESSSKGLVPNTAAHLESDLAWQNGMARIWDDLALRKYPGAFTVGDKGSVGVVSSANGETAAASMQEATSAASALLPRGLAAMAVPSLRQAVENIRSVASEQRRLKTGRRVHVLVAGSLYLVGDMLRVLGRVV